MGVESWDLLTGVTQSSVKKNILKNWTSLKFKILYDIYHAYVYERQMMQRNKNGFQTKKGIENENGQN